MKVVKRIFSKEKHSLRTRDAYAVQTGDYVGEIFVFIESTPTHHNFISVPKNINRYIPKEKFDFARNNNIIELVERIPRDVYRVLVKQFKYNENNCNN
jgi:hypothetical protein